MTVLLEASRLTKVYGATPVVEDLSFQVAAGEALGVVGPNGAGKTTTLNLVSGGVPASSGTVRFDGEDVTRLAARERTHRGMARTYQTPRPFGGMTVFENALVAADHGRASRDGDPVARAVAALEQTGLLDAANRRASELPLLRRKRLELARALATRPRLLLLDEIAGGLTEAEVRELVASIRDLRQAEITIVWIEHIVHALLSVVDTILAIDFGRKLIAGPAHQVMRSAEVRRVYLGLSAGETAP